MTISNEKLDIIPLSKYFDEMISDRDMKWYQVSNPKKVELKFDNSNGTMKTYQVYLEDVMIGYYSYDFGKYFTYLYPTFFYINDTTFLVKFGDTFNGDENDHYCLSANEIWQNGKVIFDFDSLDVSFINEISIIYCENDFDVYNHTLYLNYYNINTNKVYHYGLNDYSPGPFIVNSKKEYCIVKEILDFEISKISPFNISDYSRLQSYQKIEIENDEEVSICLGDVTQKVKLSKIEKYDSAILRDQRENGQIYLPISHFDSSFDCLDYLGSKYLDIKLVKKFIKNLYSA